MLILTRNVDEVVQIGDDIQVMVTKVEGSRVSLGITAPKSIPVARLELIDATERMRKSLAKKHGRVV